MGNIITWKLRGSTEINDKTFGIIMAIIIFAAAFFGVPYLIDFARYGSEKYEMNSMQVAATSYRAFRADGAAPTSVQDLIDGVAAADSIDGTSHERLMEPKSGRWQNGQYCDAWGQAFQFTQDADGLDIIISGGKDKQIGTEDDIIVYY